MFATATTSMTSMTSTQSGIAQRKTHDFVYTTADRRSVTQTIQIKYLPNLNEMLSKVSSNALFMRSLFYRGRPLTIRPILCFDCKTKFEYHLRFRQILLFNGREFCDKTDEKVDKNVVESDRRVSEQQKKVTVVAQKISKDKEFFYVVVQKPYELIQWVRKIPREKKKNMLFSGIIKGLKALGVVSALWVAFWIGHNGINPLTGRECVYSVPADMVKEIETDIFQEIFTKNMESKSFLPSTHPSVKRLDRCVDRLIGANSDLDLIGDGIWTPVVIDDDRVCDVVILKDSRNIFVYRKLLDLCETDDELAYVLSHQLSHLMMDHNRELVAYTPIYYLPFVTLLPRLWSLSRDPWFHWVDAVDTFLENKVKDLIRTIIAFNPYTEELEEEADRIAMQLMTRCCYDVRKCRHFCKKYRHLSETKAESKNEAKDQQNEIDYQFFTKHLITDNKLLYLFQYTKPFLMIRKRCECPPLVTHE